MIKEQFTLTHFTPDCEKANPNGVFAPIAVWVNGKEEMKVAEFYGSSEPDVEVEGKALIRIVDEKGNVIVDKENDCFKQEWRVGKVRWKYVSDCS